MNAKTILTCALTGGDDTGGKYPAVPVTPEEIADAAIGAANAGAAIVHVHVRNPETGKPSIELRYYREVFQRIHDSGSDVIVNLTTGAGARFIPGTDRPNEVAEGSNLRTPAERVRHVLDLRPEICSLDMGSLNFGKGALINVANHIELIAAEIKAAGVKPELEVFDLGHVALANDMIRRGLIEPNPLFQFVLGVPWGAPATTETMTLFRNLAPHGVNWSSFGVGRHEFPMVAQAVLLGGHVRVGLEDNLYLERGVLAESNAVLVERAVKIVRLLGSEVATPNEARSMLGLPAIAASAPA